MAWSEKARQAAKLARMSYKQASAQARRLAKSGINVSPAVQYPQGFGHLVPKVVGNRSAFGAGPGLRGTSLRKGLAAEMRQERKQSTPLTKNARAIGRGLSFLKQF